MDRQETPLLRVWPEESAAVLDWPARPPNWSSEQIDAWIAQETMRSVVRRKEVPEPWSLAWFLQIERRRYQRQGEWLPRLLEFNRHIGETILCCGQGLGTDWVQYAQHDSRVMVCSDSTEQLAVVRHHFAIRHVSGQFVHAAPTALPLPDGTIDVAVLSHLPIQPEQEELLAAELFRVLKPGGKVMAVFPAAHNATYWQRLLLPWRRWMRPVPASGAGRRFTRSTLRQIFASFAEQRLAKRSLSRAELPYLWRGLPLPVLERLMGHWLVYKGFKPLSTAWALSLAA